jgi:hypothetical protein
MHSKEKGYNNIVKSLIKSLLGPMEKYVAKRR